MLQGHVKGGYPSLIKTVEVKVKIGLGLVNAEGRGHGEEDVGLS